MFFHVKILFLLIGVLLEQANTDLNNLLSSIEIPILILDQDHKIKLFNPIALRVLNFIKTDLGRSIHELKLNVVIHDFENQIRLSLESKELKESEIQDIEGKWYRLQIRPYQTQEHHSGDCLVTLIDINNLKKKVNKAEWARDYATNVLEGIQTPFLVLDKSLKVISANKAFHKLFYINKREPIHHLLFDLGINLWSLPSFHESLGEVLLKGSVFLNEEIQSNFHGLGSRTMCLSAQVIKFDSGVPGMILLSIEDITVRKNHELDKARLLLEAIIAKKESEEASKQLRLIADAVPIHLIHLDKDEKFLFINKCAAEMWEKPIQEMVGKTIKDIVGPEKQKSLSRFTKKVMGGKSVSYESEFISPHGIQHTFLNTYTPDLDIFHNVQGFVVAGTDITERKKIEHKLTDSLETLAQERELRERFIAALSHDLRTPLAVARLGGEMLARKALDQVQILKISEKIVKNMDRADVMIRNLLDANRLKAGEKLQLEMQECDLNRITQEVLEDLKNMHGDRFLCEVKEQVIGYWDKEAIRRILENLLSNAIKYGDHYAPVKISFSQNNAVVEIAVNNVGNPIAEDDQKNIFEVFQRSESALKGSAEGWGIGLSLIKGLARAHGGDVSVRSNLSDGTTFTVKILLDSRAHQF